MKKTKVIVIVGPTASGKTTLGIHIAKQVGGEVISGDSMQIYKKMDIATAKPTAEEMDGVKHHLIGFVNPQDEYSVASFCEDAKKAVSEIKEKGKVPIIVGGTGLYIDSFINNITFFQDASSEKIREELPERESILSEEEKAFDEAADEQYEYYVSQRMRRFINRR